LDEIYEKMRNDLIKEGLLKPDEEIDNIELTKKWQELQVKQMKAAMSGAFDDIIPSSSDRTKKEGVKPPSLFQDMESPFDFTTQSTSEKEIDVREGIRQALDALLNKAIGANYCMIVVNRAWVNFRYKKNKDNLHLQVAGNKYITPMKLENRDIEHLENMGIPPEPMSIEIYARDFNKESRDFNKIIEDIIEIFKDVYHVRDGDDAYVELDLGKGEDESILKEIAKFFSSRSGKKFTWQWNNSI